MFRITEDPSSGSLVQCLAKNYKNDSILSVDMDKVGVKTAYCDPVCVCVCVCVCVYFTVYEGTPLSELHTHTQRVRICCRNTDHVHANRHDRIILVIFSQALYKVP